MFDFHWDYGPNANVDHITRHGVSPTEVESAMADRNLWWLGHEARTGEHRSTFVGRASVSGRILVVVLTDYHGLPHVVTAFRASRRIERQYLARR